MTDDRRQTTDKRKGKMVYNILLLTCLLLPFTASAADTSYTNWPQAQEWIDLTNDLYECYSAITVRCDIAGISTNGFDSPTYIYPMQDYINIAQKIEGICGYFVNKALAGTNGIFDNVKKFPQFTVSSLLASCGITNSLGATNWSFSSENVRSWAVVDHAIQTQVADAINQLAWTWSSSGANDWRLNNAALKVAYFNQWDNDDIYGATNSSDIYDKYPNDLSYGAGGYWDVPDVATLSSDIEADFYVVPGTLFSASEKPYYGSYKPWYISVEFYYDGYFDTYWWKMESASVSARPVLSNISTTSAHKADVYLYPYYSGTNIANIAAYGAPWGTNQVLCHWESISSYATTTNREGTTYYSCTSFEDPERITGGANYWSTLEPSGDPPSYDAWSRGCSVSAYWILRWQALEGNPLSPAIYTNSALPDTDRDDLVDIGVDIESFGPNSGTMVFRADQDNPYIVFPLASPPLWYGGLFVHSYLSQSGSDHDLPFQYLVSGLVDGDGYYQARSLNTCVLESDTNDTYNVKQASVLRPRGNVVAFDFEWEGGTNYNSIGYPLGSNSNRTYVLRDRTPNIHTNMDYDLCFESGVTHQFDAKGSLEAVKHIDERSLDVADFDSVASHCGYSADIEWEKDSVAKVSYAFGSDVIDVTVSSNESSMISEIQKTGVAGIEDDFAVFDTNELTITYNWGAVKRLSDHPAGTSRTVVVSTSITNVGSVTRETIFSNEDWIKTNKVSIGSDYSITAYNYYNEEGRYTNGFPKKAKLESIEYPDGSHVSFEYYPDTGWIKTETHPINEVLDKAVEYFYEAHAGDDADYEHLVERPCSIQGLIGGTIISRDLYAYYGATQVVVQQCVDASGSWGAISNLFSKNNYSSSNGLENNLLLYSSYPAGDTTYDYSFSGNNIVVKESNSTGRASSTIVNAFGCTESLIASESGHVIASAVSSVDSFGRICRTDFLDGTYTVSSNYNLFGPGTVREIDGSETSYVYYDFGGIERVDRPAFNRTTSYKHDVLGNVKEATEAGGGESVTTKSTYDVFSRLREYEDLSGKTKHVYTEESFGTTKTTTLPDGAVVVEKGNFAGNVRSVSGSGVSAEMEYEYGVSDGKYFVEERSLDNSQEWIKTYYNLLGQPCRIERPSPAGTGIAVDEVFYDIYGRKKVGKDALGIQHAQNYNPQNMIDCSGLDQNKNGVPETASNDRIQEYKRIVSGDGIENSTLVYPVSGSSAATVLSSSKTSLDGKSNTQTYAGRTSSSVRGDYSTGGKYTRTVTSSDGAKVVSEYDQWQLKEVRKYGKSGAFIEKENYFYDGLGALERVINSRSGTTRYIYDPKRRLKQLIPSDPNKESVVYGYHGDTDRIRSVTNPDGKIVFYDYYPNGQLEFKYGDTYYIRYDYDSMGRKIVMTTIKGGDYFLTEWMYDPKTGLLKYKKINGVVVEEYKYKPNGLLAAVKDADGVTTTCNYDSSSGDLVNVTHDDGVTAAITSGFGRMGRLISSAVVGGVSESYGYRIDGLLTNDVVDGGGIVSNAFISYVHASGHTGVAEMKFSSDSGLSLDASVLYDQAIRVTNIIDGDISVSYGYITNGMLADAVDFSKNGTNVMSKIVEWDYMNARITNIIYKVEGEVVAGYYYEHATNSDKISSVTLEDGSYWAYEYGPKNQLLSGRRYNSDGSEYQDQQFGYKFDSIGNTIEGGVIAENGLPANKFEASGINFHVKRIWSNKVEIVGSAVANATVTVNNIRAKRDNESFSAVIPVDTSSGASEANINVFAIWKNRTDPSDPTDVVAMATGKIYLPASNESVTNRAKGVVSQESRFAYTWDAHDRLVAVESLAADPNFKLKFDYYADGRRARKRYYEYEEDWVLKRTHGYHYDAWNLIHETIHDSSGTTIKLYNWGLDLAGMRSGKLGQKAGGIGGLISIREISGATTNTYFPICDHNGSIHKIIDDTGEIVANYEYSPFGVLIGEWGSKKKISPFRFSSKYYDEETGLYYYGYRYYDPASTKWLSRDPKGESGGINLTAFVGNDPVNKVDPLGLDPWGEFMNWGLTGKLPRGGIPIDDIRGGLAEATAQIDATLQGGANLAYEKGGVWLGAPAAGGHAVVMFIFGFATSPAQVMVGTHDAIAERAPEKTPLIGTGTFLLTYGINMMRLSGSIGSEAEYLSQALSGGSQLIIVATPFVGRVQSYAAKMGTRKTVLKNIAESQKARAASKIDVYFAKDAQIRSGYAPDAYSMGSLPKGSLVYGGAPGQTVFYTDLSTLQASHLNASKFWQSLQVKPHDIFGYRTQVQVYRVLKDVRIPQGKVLANPGLGKGEGFQYIIRDFSSVLEPVQGEMFILE